MTSASNGQFFNPLPPRGLQPSKLMLPSLPIINSRQRKLSFHFEALIKVLRKTFWQPFAYNLRHLHMCKL